MPFIQYFSNEAKKMCLENTFFYVLIKVNRNGYMEKT